MRARPRGVVLPVTQSLIQRSFAGGELSSTMYARADQVKYANGVALCQNFIIHPQGGVTKRSGLKYVATTKDSTKAAKLRRFVFSGDDQTYLLEFGDGYIRFFWHGAPVVVSGVAAWSGATAYVVGDLVVSGGVNYYCILAHTNHVPPNATYWYALTTDIYEIPTPYAIADVPLLHVTQSADVLTITHTGYVPYELQRVGHTNWQMVAFTTAPTIGPPTAGLSGVAGAAGTLTMKYVIVSAKAETYEKSYPSAVITIATCAAPTPALPNSLSWTAVSGAAEYYVYLDPVGNGIYGFINSASTNSFKDPGYQPDYTITPPVTRTLFASTNNYPGTATYYQQRLWFGRTKADPELIEGSQTGAYHNFSRSVPLEDDDAIGFTIASNHLNPVAHLIGLQLLLALSDEGEWVIKGDDAGTIRPTAINAVQIGDVGADVTVRPEIIGNSVLYAQALGVGIRALDFDQEQGGFAPNNVTLLASHLFEGVTVTEIAYAQHPYSVLWCVRSDGWLLGLTYVKEQDVWAWHRHRTTAASGLVESIAVLPDTTAGLDVLYAVVKRTINGSTVRYIEKLEAPFLAEADALEDGFFVDCGLTYDGAPATHFTGLSHLEGERVAVLADGVVISDGATGTAYTIVSGALSPDLTTAASLVHIGLPIVNCDLITLDLDVQGSDVRDRRKRLQSVSLILHATSGTLKAGPDETNLIATTREPWESATALYDGPLDINITAAWENRGRLWVRHTDPTPCTILGLMLQMGIGG